MFSTKYGVVRADSCTLATAAAKGEKLECVAQTLHCCQLFLAHLHRRKANATMNLFVRRDGTIGWKRVLPLLSCLKPDCKVTSNLCSHQLCALHCGHKRCRNFAGNAAKRQRADEPPSDATAMDLEVIEINESGAPDELTAFLSNFQAGLLSTNAAAFEFDQTALLLVRHERQWMHLWRVRKQFQSSEQREFWLCDCCEASEHTSALVTLGDFRARAAADVEAELRQVHAGFPCVHSRGAAHLFATLGRFNCVQRESQHRPVIQLRDRDVFSVGRELLAPRAVVERSSRDNLKCTSCSRARRCWHEEAVATALGGESKQEQFDAADDREEWSAAELAELDAVELPEGAKFVPLDFKAPLAVPRELVPRAPDCKCEVQCVCSPVCKCGLGRLRKQQLPGEVTVFDCKTSTVASLFRLKCDHPTCLEPPIHYDGRADCILPYTAQAFLTYALLSEFDAAMSSRPRTFTAFCLDKQKLYRHHNQTFLSKTSFTKAWWLWNSVLAIDYDKAFTCSRCDSLPCGERAYVMDAITLGIKEERMRKLAPEPAPCDDTMPCAEAKSRVFLPDTATRALLRQYCQRELTRDEMSELIRDAPSGLARALRFLSAAPRSHFRAPEITRRVFMAMTYSTPVSGFILRPAEAVNALTMLGRGESVRGSVLLLAQLFDCCQAISKLVTHSDFDGDWQREFSDLFQFFADLCKSLSSGLDEDYQRVEAQSPGSAEADMSRGCFFGPSMRDRRPMHKYEADGDAKRGGDRVRDRCHRVDGRKHSKLSPGLFTVFCTHGVCVGFQLLRDCESVRVPFEIFYSRLPRAPGMLVYDRACHLHTYALRREPWWFHHTVFRVDITHVANHTACSEGYSAWTYRTGRWATSARNYAYANTQVAEQCNSALKYLRTPCSFMTPAHFMRYTRTFFALRNLEKLKSVNA